MRATFSSPVAAPTVTGLVLRNISIDFESRRVAVSMARVDASGDHVSTETVLLLPAAADSLIAYLATKLGAALTASLGQNISSVQE